ncbi:MAG: hypothetical protein IPM95_12230 [Sphingobacteriales bacterium]|nr:hypothetical protein [Sphingobacteriales bacterium]
MNFLQSPGFILRVIIAAGYIILGILLIIHPSVLGFLTKDMTRAFSAVLIIYGLFRGYRAYQFFNDEE